MKRRGKNRTGPVGQGGKASPVPAGSSDRPRSTKRLWLFRLSAILLSPLFFLLLLETGLRLGGVGHPVSFLLRTRLNEQNVFVQNDRFAWRFFGPDLAREPSVLLIPEAKPADTIRVVVFGESAAFGDPQPEFGLPRMLQVLLNARFPQTRFEVINAAMTAINSHAILPIARNCAALKSDIWVLYMGNNEVVGPFGAGTVFGLKAPSLALVRGSLAVKATCTGQWLESLGRSLQKRAPSEKEWGGMQMFVRNQVGQDAPSLARVYGNFERNLKDIVKTGTGSGAKVVVSTVASNLKDCAPFASAHRPGISAPELAKWDELRQKAITEQQAGKFAQASELCAQAEKIDGTYAELQFMWGQCCVAQGQDAETRRHFTLARDLDVLRFRCDTRLNDIIRRTASNREQQGVLFADAEAALARQSPHGVEGNELFYEHVHLTFEGNYLLAVSLAEHISRLLPESVTGKGGAVQSWLSVNECAQRLAWSDLNRYEAASLILNRLKDPPFATQLNHADQEEKLRRQLEELLPGTQPAALREAQSRCRDALAHWPDDYMLHRNLARVQQKLGDFSGAADSLRHVVDEIPHHAEAWEELGGALALQNHAQEARAAFQEALKRNPGSASAHTGLAQVLAHLGDNPEAIREYEAALKLKSYWSPAHLGLGKLLEASGRPAEAQSHFQAALHARMNTSASYKALAQLCFEKGWYDQAATNFADALRINPSDAETHVNLGLTLALLGRHGEAQSHYAEAVRLDPNLVEARERLGLELGRQGDNAGAAEQFAESVRLRPDLLDARLNLGIALSKQQRTAEAREQFQEVLRRDPTNATALKWVHSLTQSP